MIDPELLVEWWMRLIVFPIVTIVVIKQLYGMYKRSKHLEKLEIDYNLQEGKE